MSVKTAKPTVRLSPRRGDELHAGTTHVVVCHVEISDGQEKPDAAGGLLPDGRVLSVAIRAGEEDACLRTWRPDGERPFRTAIVRE